MPFSWCYYLKMLNFVIIFLCMLAGIIAKRSHYFPNQTVQVLNSFIITISLPALVLSTLPQLLRSMDFSGPWWIPVSMAWITFILAFFFFLMIGKRLKWSKAKIGALILTAGLGNTSFVGFPILEAIIGSHAIPIGILVDQPGSFLVLSTLGIMVAAVLSGTDISPKFIVKRVISFPPFIAMILSIIWAFAKLERMEIVTESMSKIAMTLVPLALFSVGYQLKFDPKVLRKRWIALSLGLVFKLILIPLIFSFLMIKVIKVSDLVTQVVVLESAMATMITSAVVATEFHLDSEMANLMVGISIPISLISVPLWNYFLFT